ncbi:MAG: MFS transporter, partial [Phycisphaerae bacterium]
QILQIPSVFLVDRIRRRKAMVVIASILSRLMWLVVAALPWFFPPDMRIPLLVGSLLVYFGLGAISGCAFNSWMRDLIPESIMGSYFARRMAVSIALGAGLSLAAGFGVDFTKRWLGVEALPYSVLFLLGAVAGLAGAVALARIPEPRMAPPEGKRGMLAVLSTPFRDHNYRRLLVFLGWWNFAINLAGPFFVVYMLQRLGLTIAWVLVLAVVSQLVNVLFLKLWGRLADLFSNKSVLAASGPMFVLSIVLWVFTTLPEKHFLTIPLLFFIHAFAGMSTAGVSLCAGNLALRSAPKGEATAYLATNSLVSGMAATIAPILGGLAADWFATQEVAVTLSWSSTGGGQWAMPALSLRGLDFLFIASFLFGLYAMHRLLAVKEEGEAEEGVVLTQFYSEVRKSVRHVSNVAGLRHLTYFPYVVARRLKPEEKIQEPDQSGPAE